MPAQEARPILFHGIDVDGAEEFPFRAQCRHIKGDDHVLAEHGRIVGGEVRPFDLPAPDAVAYAGSAGKRDAPLCGFLHHRAVDIRTGNAGARTIFMTSALKEELKKWLNQLAADERKDPTRYHDSGMLFRLPNGLAVEPVLIRKKFLKWQDAHPEFPRIVFHGLRHSSATYQLMISGGDVKAVQGTTGHATADMLVNTYAHIQQSSRVELGKKFEEGFYAKSESPSPQAVPAAGEPTISMTALLELLKNADPEVKAQLRLALLT